VQPLPAVAGGCRRLDTLWHDCGTIADDNQDISLFRDWPHLTTSCAGIITAKDTRCCTDIILFLIL
jgi:hypothetical protein